MKSKEELTGFIWKLLEVTSFDIADEIWWRTDGEYSPVTFFVVCNDLFWWGTADCEAITPENIYLLEESIKELKELGESKYYLATSLFCCKARKMRPQKPFYKEIIPENCQELFNACGPERDE